MRKQEMGKASSSSFVTPKSSTIYGTAFDGNEEPSVLLMTLMIPPKKTSIFLFTGQLLGCSGSSDRKEITSFEPHLSD
jgi:hypothetical protein